MTYFAVWLKAIDDPYIYIYIKALVRNALPLLADISATTPL